ncbi:MAG: four helix bundle protein [Acidobacteria bacterium]|nr:four helix bundle protein [Acidobacteriota bacterium]
MPSHLAEGCGRAGDREFRRFLRVSLGSASELEYHFLLAGRPRLSDRTGLPAPD